MKIIICTFLLCITAVSVFGKSVELNGIVGKSIEFPAAVETSGNLIYSSKANAGVTIGDVTSGYFTPQNEKFRDRLQWHSSTGHFSLSELKLEDSGVYKVEKNDGQKSPSFNLTVWKDNVPVSKPHVSVTRDEYPCTLLCSVERGTGATLSWYREGEKKPYGSSSVRSGLDLPQTVDKGGIYTCEANNSVSRETSDPLTVGAHCKGGAAGIWQTEGSKIWSLCLVLIAMVYSRLV